MTTETFVLSSNYPDCTLTTYIHSPSAELAIDKRRAIIVCPGGGYAFLSDREAEPVALKYFADGLNVFILRYSVGAQAANFGPLTEAALAISHIRINAEKYHVDPDYVFITGFSAGGHLAASAGTLWKLPILVERLKSELGEGFYEGINRPTATVLCYPVITCGIYGHLGSTQNLAGKLEPTKEDIATFSLENHVDETTSPAFIWHTFTDGAVPIQNTLLYASALAASNVPFEYHVFPDGVHGLSLCNTETWSNIPALINPTTQGWIDMAIRYVKDFK